MDRPSLPPALSGTFVGRSVLGRIGMNKPTKLSLPVSALVTIVAALVAAFAIPARAEGPIARVPAVQENSTDPDVKAMFDNARNRGGQVINLGLIRGNAPKLARAASAVAYAIRFDTKTPRALIELAILRTAQLWEGDYEINQHRPMMRACGYTPQQIEAVGNWRASTLFNDRQRALLAYVDQAARGDVDDATFAARPHHREHRLHRVQRTPEVDVHALVVVLLGH